MVSHQSFFCRLSGKDSPVSRIDSRSPMGIGEVYKKYIEHCQYCFVEVEDMSKVDRFAHEAFIEIHSSASVLERLHKELSLEHPDLCFPAPPLSGMKPTLSTSNGYSDSIISISIRLPPAPPRA